jgi:hypothetical protein
MTRSIYHQMKDSLCFLRAISPLSILQRLAIKNHTILDRPNPINVNLHNVSVLQQTRRLHKPPYATWSTRHYHTSGPHRPTPGQMPHSGWDVK